MTGEQTLLARGVLGVVSAAAGVALVRWSWPQRLARPAFDRAVYSLFLASRLGLFLLVFVVLRIPVRGDVIGYYVPEGLAAMHGLLPYRDFESSYAPLHGFLDALVLRVWNSPRALILFALLTESAALPLWMRLARRIRPEQTVRRAALLYFASAISLQFCALDGQDNVVIALLLAAGVLLATLGRDLLAGALVGLGAVAVKIIPLGYVPVLFAAAPRRWRWTAGLLAVVGLGYGAFARQVGAAVLMPLSREGDLKSAGDLPYVVEALTGRTLPGAVSTLLLAAAGLAILLRVISTVRRSGVMATRVQATLFGITATTLALELFSKKSWPPYLMLVLFPLLLSVAAATSMWTATAIGGFGVVALVEHSYWATVLHQFDSPAFHAGLLHGDRQCLVFLLLELLLLCGYGWLLLLSWHAMDGVVSAAAKAAPDGTMLAQATHEP